MIECQDTNIYKKTKYLQKSEHNLGGKGKDRFELIKSLIHVNSLEEVL